MLSPRNPSSGSSPVSPYKIAAIVLLSVLFLINCYRAATQSITHDEALTWEFYLSGPASAIFEFYDANNHFLATLLFRVSTTLFGVSPLAMRIPTLLAGAWYFWSVYSLCGLVAGGGLLFLVMAGLLALNPIVLDFLVAARGYGLAMAGLFWALLQMIVYLRDSTAAGLEPRPARLWKAAAGLGVAFAANLTMLVPDAALAATFGFLLWHRRRGLTPPATVTTTVSSKKKKKARKTSTTAVNGSTRELLHFLVPLFAAGLAYALTAPIETASMKHFYAGTDSAMASLRNLAEASFVYRDLFRTAPLREAWLWTAVAFLITGVLAGAWMAIRSLRTKGGQTATPAETAVVLTSVTVVSSALLLGLAHAVKGVPYPENRTGLYFVPLCLLCTVSLLKLWERPGVAWRAAVAVCGLLAVAFAAQMRLQSFYLWHYDADTERIFPLIEKYRTGSGPVRLGASWVLEPALNFYRVTRRADWMELVRRDGFDGDRQFYLFVDSDRGEMERLGLKELYRGPVSGTVLAVSPAAPQR